jgi:hypothetical protein
VAKNGTIFLTGFVEKNNCEGGGWFIRKYGPSGKALRSFGRFQKKRLQQCTMPPQFTSDIAVRANQVVVAGSDFGCCADPETDGWVRAFDAGLHPTWQTDFEPPATTPHAWFDSADGIAIGAGGNIFASGWAASGPPTGDVSEPAPGTVVLEKLTPAGSPLW